MIDPAPPDDGSALVHPLDNPVWTSLTTELASFAVGSGRARMFRREVSMFAALADDDLASWSDLASLAGSGDVMICGRHGVEPPADWTLLGGGVGHQMVFDATGEASASIREIGRSIALRPLRADDDDDVDAMVELVALTQPGPFRRRTIELGGYVGVHESDRLIAMAGQRMRTSEHTEISAVCTHPDARGRGLAAATTAAVASGILARGSTPILHVAESNVGARRIYDTLGFRTRTTITFAAVRPPGGSAGPAHR